MGCCKHLGFCSMENWDIKSPFENYLWFVIRPGLKNNMSNTFLEESWKSTLCFALRYYSLQCNTSLLKGPTFLFSFCENICSWLIHMFSLSYLAAIYIPLRLCKESDHIECIGTLHGKVSLEISYRLVCTGCAAKYWFFRYVRKFEHSFKDCQV